MWSALFVELFLGQAVAAAIVIFFLAKILNKTLVEAGIKQYKYSKGGEKYKVKKVEVITRKTLSSKDVDSLRNITDDHFGAAMQVVFVRDKYILGGVIIKIGPHVIDFSLRDRLKQAFGR